MNNVSTKPNNRTTIRQRFKDFLLSLGGRDKTKATLSDYKKMTRGRNRYGKYRTDLERMHFGTFSPMPTFGGRRSPEHHEGRRSHKNVGRQH